MTAEQRRRENDMRNERRRSDPERYRAVMKQWRDANPDKIRTHHARWLAKNPDYYRQYEQSRRERPPGYNLEKQREWRKRNIERERSRHRRYWARLRELRPEQHREKGRRANARARKVPMDQLASEFAAVLRADPCCYCGSHDRLTIDHIEPVALGGTSDWDNLTASCKSCNSSKHTRRLLEFLA